MISRRFPVKCMFIGIVVRPQPNHNFGGGILLERVSTSKKLISKRTVHQQFSDDVIIKLELKAGRWRYIHLAYMPPLDSVSLIAETFDLDKVTADCIKLQYTTKVGKDGKTKVSAIPNISIISQVKISRELR